MLLLIPILSLIAQTSTLPQAFDAIAKEVPGVLGVSAELLETGETAGLRETDRFPMQSVYKLPIAMAILDQVDRHALTLNMRVRLSAKDMAPAGVHSPIRDAHPQGHFDLSVQELIRAAISDSDGSASDVLFRLGGGSARLTGYLRGIGIRNINIAATEAAMATDQMVQYRNDATPHDAVQLLKALNAGRGVSPEARTMLLKYMTESPTGPNRIKGGLPAGTVVAHKTGTDGTHNGLTRATNDIGIVTLPDGRHFAIAIFLKDSTGSQELREGAIAKVARAAWDRWTGGMSR